jgi:hypothetical protein
MGGVVLVYILVALALGVVLLVSMAAVGFLLLVVFDPYHPSSRVSPGVYDQYRGWCD